MTESDSVLPLEYRNRYYRNTATKATAPETRALALLGEAALSCRSAKRASGAEGTAKDAKCII
jgi:hypothetical protein